MTSLTTVMPEVVQTDSECGPRDRISDVFPTVHTTVPGLFIDNLSPLKVLGVFEEERGILGVS